MSDRVMSPIAAEKHALRLIRERYKKVRRGERVDPPAIVAERLITFSLATARKFPVEPSVVYEERVRDLYARRFLELCASYPVPVKAGPR
jgi:hypothetical protein